ncbi:hypothetical protein R1flu_014356 [Riccia fluitans]|uniref:Methyltransferase type 12 domain-containing protein n=1 Tax=Riccia fluitans TaxID=41844 RepID=A0ABD1YG80_9MARC
MGDILYSYFQPSFVDFYDMMVETCFGGIHSTDVQEFCTLFKHRLESSSAKAPEFRTVDLGTGTGRCILALLNSLQEGKISQKDLHFLGLDNSEVMIKRALEKLQSLSNDESKKNVTVGIKVQSLEDWDVPEWHEGVDLILAAAGPFHHLLTESAVVRTLKQIELHLKAKGEGLAVINLLSPDQLFHREIRDSEGLALTEEAFKVGPYRRWRVNHEMSVVDGARVMHEKFKLTRVSADESVEWEEQEEWTLREVDRDRLVSLAAQVGLEQLLDVRTPCKDCLFFQRK